MSAVVIFVTCTPMQNALENAKKTFAIELDALRGVAENLDVQFQQCVEAILSAK